MSEAANVPRHSSVYNLHSRISQELKAFTDITACTSVTRDSQRLKAFSAKSACMFITFR
ncbi:hypothetical protein DPMN_040267 [Dreissena polymorpha]|uniref:Uncharacterized protein n=1 Tax=Dreissena polymorpha TaxID=45954 RepID=A0A9D4CVN9_DREPO|nr:hypothetical protein DPMN_040267 [Dreissena polymorpha]